jgi:hypothetical protein
VAASGDNLLESLICGAISPNILKAMAGPPDPQGKLKIQIVESCHLNFSTLFELANDARLRCPPDCDNETPNPSAVFESRKHAISTIMLGVAGCEAFINELANDCADNVGKQSTERGDPVEELSRTLPLLEEARAQLNLKFQAASTILYRAKPNLGIRPFQDFEDLIGLRNDVTHVKRMSVVAVHADPVTDAPRAVRRVLKRRPTPKYRHARNYHWMQMLMRRWVADWVCDTTDAICSHILDGIADEKITKWYRDEIRAGFSTSTISRIDQ